VPRRKPPDEAIQSFARQLGALRVACGSPPYTQLYKISSMLPPATVSGVLNARTAPKLAFVLAFVRAVLACADASDISVPGADPVAASLGADDCAAGRGRRGSKRS
jgi:hypothetical protein